jgi:hypothetical protein
MRVTSKTVEAVVPTGWNYNGSLLETMQNHKYDLEN